MKHLFLFASLFLSLTAQKARAQSCTAAGSDLVFGAADLVSGASFTTSGTIVVRCNGTIGKNIRTCLSLGEGTGGSSSGSPRFMKLGASSLNYNLYTSAGGAAAIYGSFVWPHAGSIPGVRYVNTVPSTGTYTINSQVFARVSAGQTVAITGNYLSSFNGSQGVLHYDYNDTLPCSSLPSLSTPIIFDVRVDSVPSCVISATDMDFGITAGLTSNIDASSQLRVRCSNSTPYRLALNGGNSGAASGGMRKMSASSAGFVNYQLYKDTARTQVWGYTASNNDLAGIGDGLTQVVNVYGRVPPQTTPAPATYSDRITVTITY